MDVRVDRKCRQTERLRAHDRRGLVTDAGKRFECGLVARDVASVITHELPSHRLQVLGLGGRQPERRDPPFTRIPARLGNDQFFTTYSLMIASVGARPYWPPLERWILAYHERTGNPHDRVVRFTAYLLSDRSPAPGKGVSPSDTRKVPFITYPSPN